MPAITTFRDLIAWQRSMELADLVDAMTCEGRAASFNRRFTEQIQGASAKAPAQIAEGFLRFKPKESAYFYRIARASLGETQTHLERGLRRRYWSQEEFERAHTVSDEALRVTTGLLNDRLRVIAEEIRNKPAKSNSLCTLPAAALADARHYAKSSLHSALCTAALGTSNPIFRT
jgi:four helix bundle protein